MAATTHSDTNLTRAALTLAGTPLGDPELDQNIASAVAQADAAVAQIERAAHDLAELVRAVGPALEPLAAAVRAVSDRTSDDGPYAAEALRFTNAAKDTTSTVDSIAKVVDRVMLPALHDLRS